MKTKTKKSRLKGKKMKFKSTVFIGKVFFYLVFPILFLVVSFLISFLKCNLITFLLSAIFMFLAFLTPWLAKDLLFKYCDEIEKEFEEKK